VFKHPETFRDIALPYRTGCRVKVPNDPAHPALRGQARADLKAPWAAGSAAAPPLRPPYRRLIASRFRSTNLPETYLCRILAIKVW
jgi:hypothetical protein